MRRAWRSIRARPLGAATHVALIAVAVGATAVAFASVDSFVFRRSPYPHAGRILAFQRTSPVGVIDNLEPGEYESLRARADIFASFYRYSMGPTIYAAASTTLVPLQSYDVQPGLFEALGVAPRWGRPLVADDARRAPGQADVALLGADAARRLFGSTEGAVGRTIGLPPSVLRVVGVMPDDFRFPVAIEDVWRPLIRDSSSSGEAIVALALVRPGVSMPEARAAVTAVLGPPRGSAARSMGAVRPVPLVDAIRDPRAYTNAGAFTALDAPRLFTVLLAAAIALAVIVCLNLAGLNLALALERGRVVAIETALGASRAALIRSSLFEAALLTGAGALLGAAIATWGAAALNAALPVALTSTLANPIDVDWRAGAVMGLTSLFATLTISIPAVWRVTRPIVMDRLRRETAGLIDSPGRQRVRTWLMTGEVALCAGLLVVAVPLGRTYAARLRQQNGIDTAAIVAVSVTRTPAARVPAADLDRRLEAVLRSDPSVRGVSRTARLLPGLRGGVAEHVWVNGVASSPGQAALTMFDVDPDYFATMGIRLLSGEWPRAGGGAQEIVVDESFARRFWPDGRAVGSRFSFGSAEAPGRTTFEVAGVASDVRLDTSQVPLGGEVFVGYRALRDDAAPLTFVAHTASGALPRELLGRLQATAAGCTVRVTSMAERYEAIYGDARIGAVVTAGLGLFAFITAMAGLYAITTFLVVARTREIGLRVALGADRGDVQRLVLGPAVRIVLIGTLAGIGCGFALSRVVASAPFGIGSADPATFAGVALVVAATALAATRRPARRALRIDAAVALRGE